MLGMCPFSGLVIYMGFYHIGTFCGDGTFELPIGRDIYQKDVPFFLIYYSLPTLAQLFFTIKGAQFRVAAGTFVITDPCNMHLQSLQANTLYEPLSTDKHGNLNFISETFHSENFRTFAYDISYLVWIYKYNDISECNVTISARALYTLALYSTSSWGFTRRPLESSPNSARQSTELGITKPFTCSVRFDCENPVHHLEKTCSMSSRTVVLTLKKGACWQRLYAVLTLHYYRFCSPPVTGVNVVPIQYGILNLPTYQIFGLCGFARLDLYECMVLEWMRGSFANQLCELYTTLTFSISSSDRVSLNLTLRKKFNVSESIHLDGIRRTDIDFDLCTTISTQIHICQSTANEDHKASVNISTLFHEFDGNEYFDISYPTSIPCDKNISQMNVTMPEVDVIGFCKDTVKSPLRDTNYMYAISVVGFYDSEKDHYKKLIWKVYPSYLFLWVHNLSLSRSNIKCTSLGERWQVMAISDFSYIIAIYS